MCRKSFVLTMVIACLSLSLVARGQQAQSTSFTHQGELRSNGVVVDGVRDLKFRLYDAPTGGNQIGAQLQASALTIDQGRFAVQLDFGAAAFAGQARWLEIDVSTGPGSPTFTTLAPRQAITSTPYAAYALSAGGEIVCSVDAQFSIDDRSGWTHVEALGDDTCFPNIPLGFTFTGWGRADTTVSVSSNGILFFGSSGCSTSFTNTALPAGISNSPFLAFFWDDLFDYSAGEYFEYSTLGTPGGRVFNLFFRNRLLSSVCGTDAVNLMISIHEGSNLIHVSYSGFSGCYNIRGGGATFGLQGPGGTNAKAFMVGFNAPILDNDASRQSISFTPPKQ